MEAAARSVEVGKSIRTAAQIFGVNPNSLKRYIDRYDINTLLSTKLYGYGYTHP